jgi:hypothetical protein
MGEMAANRAPDAFMVDSDRTKRHPIV